MGFTPLAEGNTLASATYRFLVPQTAPWGSTTPFEAWADMRFVPIWEESVSFLSSQERRAMDVRGVKHGGQGARDDGVKG
jgi:hypothetical protein